VAILIFSYIVGELSHNNLTFTNYDVSHTISIAISINIKCKKYRDIKQVTNKPEIMILFFLFI
jgi:hypothetical protein